MEFEVACPKNSLPAAIDRRADRIVRRLGALDREVDGSGESCFQFIHILTAGRLQVAGTLLQVGQQFHRVADTRIESRAAAVIVAASFAIGRLAARRQAVGRGQSGTQSISRVP
jgi:uncharacterized Ntn-hydrolase superfamily protein